MHQTYNHIHVSTFKRGCAEAMHTCCEQLHDTAERGTTARADKQRCGSSHRAQIPSNRHGTVRTACSHAGIHADIMPKHEPALNCFIIKFCFLGRGTCATSSFRAHEHTCSKCTKKKNTRYICTTSVPGETLKSLLAAPSAVFTHFTLGCRQVCLHRFVYTFHLCSDRIARVL